jgi:hypothetical protein
MRHRRTLGPVIPPLVVSPKSQLLFHWTKAKYRGGKPWDT